MKRAIDELTNNFFDVAIIGAGIYGASVARDAALRGLSVALVDKGDFGNATSANCQKIIHGGLRYLQHMDFKRMRESIRERSTLMRIAPHLVTPMPFLIPTYRRWSQGKLVMGIALTLNDLVSFDRNRHQPRDRYIPNGRLLSKAECLRLCPGLDRHDLTGGAMFYDGRVYNADRFTLSVLLSAERAGAHLANYVHVTRLIKDQTGISGIFVKDIQTSETFEVRARLVINCSGPWFNDLFDHSHGLGSKKKVNLIKGVVLVTRQLVNEVAVGIPGQSSFQDQDAVIQKGHRYFFILPWRNRSLIGTFNKHDEGAPGDLQVTEQDIQDLLDEINAGFPVAKLKRGDVQFVNAGFLPLSEKDEQVAKHYEIYDHEEEEGLSGLLSVIGVKYTTARDVAEKAVNLVLRKIGRKYVPSRTANIPLYGGDLNRVEACVRGAVENKPRDLTADSMEHLVQTYGSAFPDVLKHGEQDPGLFQCVGDMTPVIKAEIVHAVREEMAQNLGDVIFRRTELGTAGFPGEMCLNTCADIMQHELDWTAEKRNAEVEEVKAVYEKLGVRLRIKETSVCPS